MTGASAVPLFAIGHLSFIIIVPVRGPKQRMTNTFQSSDPMKQFHTTNDLPSLNNVWGFADDTIAGRQTGRQADRHLRVCSSDAFRGWRRSQSARSSAVESIASPRGAPQGIAPPRLQACSRKVLEHCLFHAEQTNMVSFLRSRSRLTASCVR